MYSLRAERKNDMARELSEMQKMERLGSNATLENVTRMDIILEWACKDWTDEWSDEEWERMLTWLEWFDAAREMMGKWSFEHIIHYMDDEIREDLNDKSASEGDWRDDIWLMCYLKAYRDAYGSDFVIN